jgi:Tol biopolymer transport system component
VLLGSLAYATWRLLNPVAAHPIAPEHRQVTFSGSDAGPALSPDGKFVAYVADDPPLKHVTIRSVDGGQPVTIASATVAGMLRWSPDGTQVMFFLRGGDRNGIYLSSRTGGGLTHVAAGPHRSCWSPDGRTIATVQPFVGRVRLRDVATGVDRLVTLAGRHDWIWDLDWSPSGDRLLLVSQHADRFTVLTVRADGQHQRTIRSDTREIPGARWSPRGDAIYYSRRVDHTVSIFKVPVSADGDAITAGVPLLTGLESDGFFELSADGRRLTYARDPYYSNLWLVDISRGSTAGAMTARQLTSGTSQAERPSVSPDGASVLFTLGRETASNLYVLPLAGGAPRQLTFFAGFTSAGIWSPGGRQIAFASDEGGSRRVWITNDRGAPARPVSTGAMSDSLDMSWQDESRLYYQQTGNRDFYVLDARGSRPEPMLWQRQEVMGWVFSPVVSPDGRRVAVKWNRPKGRGIWTLDVATGRQTKLIDDEQSGVMPLAWSRDGQRLFLFTGERAAYRGLAVRFGETTKDTRVLTVPAAGGAVTTLAVLPFPEVGGVAITPDGRRIVCAVYTSRSDVWIVDHFDPGTSITMAVK